MEPENEPLEEEIPIRNHHFQVPWQFSGGYTKNGSFLHQLISIFCHLPTAQRILLPESPHIRSCSLLIYFNHLSCVLVSFDMFYPTIHFPTAHPAVATMASSCVASPDIPHSSTTASARLTAWCSFGISRIGSQKELLMEEMLQHLGCIKPYR